MTEDMAKLDYEQLCKEYEFKIEELNRENFVQALGNAVYQTFGL